MGITLEPIKPFHPQFHPDPSWERVGLTPAGHQLFRETTRRSRAIPDIDPATGEQRHELHPTTGQPLYPRNKPEIYNHIRMFYLESEGNGNITKIDWREPTAEELAAVRRSEGIAKLIPNLSETLYDADIDMGDLVAALRMISQATKGELPDEAPPVVADTPEPQTQAVIEAQAPVASTPVVADAQATFPKWRGAAGWELSDGTFMKGVGVKEKAVAAEAALHQEEVAAVP